MGRSKLQVHPTYGLPTVHSSLTLDLETTLLSLKCGWKAKIIHNILFSLAILKTLHIVYALAALIMYYEPESFATTTLILCSLSLFATSVYWGLELFHRGLQETVILFSYVQFRSSDVTGSWMWTLRSVDDLRKTYSSFKDNIGPV